MTIARERVGSARPWAWYVLAAAALLLIALGVWAWLASRPETARVLRRDVVAYVPAKGEVIAPPDERAEVYPPYAAPVARVLTTVGATVRRGDVLLELSQPSAQAAYEQARAALEAARTAYESARKTYGAEVEAARRALEQARAVERAARQGPSVQVTPLEDGTAVTIREREVDLRAATQARLAAEQRLLEAEARYEAALRPYRQQLEAAEEAFRAAQAGRRQAMVRAPISGTVLQLDAQPGEVVGDERRPVAVIVDLSALQVLAELDPDEAARVEPGMPANITVEQLRGETFTGRVDSLTTEPPRPLRRARYVAVIDLENERGLVKPGMDAHASIRIGEAKNALVVPNEALREDASGRPVVRVLRNGRWQEVVVEPGLTDGRFIEIRSGLREGEIVQVPGELF